MQAVGAADAQASSGLLVLCVTVGLSSIAFAWIYRIPISTAWSTPGAALLVAAGQNHANFAGVAGAFIVCCALIVLCGLWPALGRLVTSIPKPIASAMLAGILFPICLAPVLSTFGYTVPPRPVLIGTGVASAAGAVFGGHAINLATNTAAIMASPEAHPDRSKRWIATFS